VGPTFRQRDGTPLTLYYLPYEKAFGCPRAGLVEPPA
jgi:hypothetical protein